MKRIFLVGAVALFTTLSPIHAQLGKEIGKAIGSKAKGKGKETSGNSSKSKEPGLVLMNEIEGDFSDDWGYSGKYFMLDTAWVTYDNYSANPKKQLVDGNYVYTNYQKWKFTREEGGNIVNSLNRYEGEKLASGGGKSGYKLNEKFKEKFDITLFRYDFSGRAYVIIQFEKDVWGEAQVDFHKNTIVEYLNTFAKDQAQLEIYDMETSAAVMQKKLNEIKLKEAEADRVKWMKNETFAKMVGKIGFIDQYNKVSYNRNDILEKQDVFTSSIELGKQSLFYRAYYETPGNILCNGCELNTTYEINGIKVSRVEQRKQSAKWSRMIKQKFVDNNFFTGAPPIVSFSENIADYAFLYCLYQNKDKIKNGTTLKMKVTLTTNQEGVDKDVLAEGTISLVYKDANKAGFDKMMKWIEDFLEE